MNAFCKICKTNIVATDRGELSVLMLAHILTDHCRHPKYAGKIEELLRLAKEDYEVDFKGDVKK